MKMNAETKRTVSLVVQQQGVVGLEAAEASEPQMHLWLGIAFT
jgi:hypothetical protein